MPKRSPSTRPRQGKGTGAASNGPFIDNERQSTRPTDEASHGGGKRNAEKQASRDHTQERILPRDNPLPDDKGRMAEGTRTR